MTEEQFWYGEIELLEVYQKAYYRHTHYIAWLNGQNSKRAYEIALDNAFAKQGSKLKDFPQWEDPVEKLPFSKKRVKIDSEKEFRKQQIEQNNWLFSR